MTDNIIFAFEIVGVVAFAISGALVGIEKKMDILGISILGLSVACGGGVIRDLVLGIREGGSRRLSDEVFYAVSLV